MIVETTVSEGTIADLLRREIRWSRTIRTVRPVGHFLTILTMPLVWAVIVLIAGRFSPLACIVAAAALAVRIGMHVVAPASASLNWIPIRDALTFFVYCASFFGRSVVWRERRFDVSADGELHAAKS